MKVLITSDWYEGAVNGVVSSILALRKGLEELGHEARILTLSESGSSFAEGDVYHQTSHGCSFIYAKARFSLHLDRSLLDEIIAWNPDIIHSQCEFSTFRMARKIARALDIPIVHTFHTDYEYYVGYCHIPSFLGRTAVRYLFRRTAENSAAVIVPTAKTGRLVAGYGIGSTCFVVPSGIDLSRFSLEHSPDRMSQRRSLGIDEGAFVLLYLGRLAEEKDIDVLLECVHGVKGRNLQLLIAGDGPYRSSAEKLCNELGLADMVHFAGMIPPEKVPEVYGLADAFVTASLSETQGLCTIEAMASGLPVICRQDPAVDSVVIDGFNGFVFSDEHDFAAIISRIMQDPEQLSALGMNALDTAKAFSIPAFAGKAEEIYLSVIGAAQDQKKMAQTLRWEAADR